MNTQRERITIGFGSTVRLSGSDQEAVVVDVGDQEGDFEASALHETEQGLNLGRPGGVCPSRIVEVTGKLSRDEVIRAAKLNARSEGYYFTKEMKEELIRLSEKQPRVI